MSEKNKNEEFFVVFERDPEQKGGDERRRDVRVPIVVWAEETSGDDVIYNCTANLSEGGVFFDQAVPYKVGTVLTLKIPIPGSDEEIRAKGEVVRVPSSGSGMGIRFTSVEPGGKDKLIKLLDGSG